MNFFHLLCVWVLQSVPSCFASQESKVNVPSSTELMKQFSESEFYKVWNFEALNGYNIPVNNPSTAYHSVNDEDALEEFSRAKYSGFYNSNDLDPIVYYECPNGIHSRDSLINICANFRAIKTSIDTDAFKNSVKEKFEFINAITALGVFYEPEIVYGKNKANYSTQEFLQSRLEYSATSISSYYCRDSLKFVADLLDSSQIQWLLRYAPISVICNSEFMNSLTDFSMFKPENVVAAFEYGYYNWYDNPIALKTLTPSALKALFRSSRYDLSYDKLELLNASRPIEELFKTPEFVSDPFIWQVTAGTRFYSDDHFKFDDLVDLILSDEDNSKCSLIIREVIFSFCVHNETAINSHFAGIYSVLRNLDKSIFDSSESDEISLKQFQINAIHNHLSKLDLVFYHRSRIIDVFTQKYENNEAGTDFNSLMKVLVTPSSYLLRKALTVYMDIKLPENCSMEDLHQLLLDCYNCEASEFVYYQSSAIILAFFKLKVVSYDISYFDSSDKSRVYSTMDVLYKFCEAYFGLEFIDFTKTSNLIKGKFERLFLIHQALDFKISKKIQIAEQGEIVADTLDIILNVLLKLCDLSVFCDKFLDALKNDFGDLINVFLINVDIYNRPEIKYHSFRKRFNLFYEQYLESKESSNNPIFFSDAIQVVSSMEAILQCIVQNSFKTEMIDMMLEDEAFVHVFSDFALFLNRSQVKAILSNQSGRKLLASNKKLLYNLATYEDFSVTDIIEFKFQAQYATMVRTLPIIPLLFSFQSDKFIFNDPLAVSARLISSSSEIWISHEKVLLNSWKFVPFQAIAEFWGHSGKDLASLANVVSIKNYLVFSKDVQGKGLESCRVVLQWLIISEIRYLESFVLIQAQQNLRWQAAMTAILFVNKEEQSCRLNLNYDWLVSISFLKDVVQNLRADFLDDLRTLINGPLSQIRAGTFLAGHNVMTKTLRLVNYCDSFIGFDDWMKEAKKSIKSIPNQVAEAGNLSSSNYINLLKCRKFVEEDTKNRRELLFKMLNELNVALGIKNDSNLQLWKSRLDLLGFLSADGYSSSPSFNFESNLNLPLHESVLLHNLKKMTIVNPNQELISNVMVEPEPLPVAALVSTKKGKSSKKGKPQK